VNSSAEVKAICGLYGGSVCTSANAKVMLDWALQQGDAVLFLPDRHLGDNTANQLHLDTSERLVVDIRTGRPPVDPKKAPYARLLLWPGSCAIHHTLKKRHVEEMRKAMPGVRVVVHPECPPAVVRAADSAGSTSHIIKYCAEAKAGARIAVGTEENLVLRLAERHKAEGKTIVPLKPHMRCSNMAKITEERLADLLDTLDDLADSGNAVLAALGLPQHPADAYRYFAGLGIEEPVRRMLPEDRRDPATVKEAGALTASEYKRRWKDKTRPYDGVPEMLAGLRERGLPVSVLSNKPQHYTDLTVDAFFPGRPFTHVRGARPEVPNKPHPAGALALARELMAWKPSMGRSSANSSALLAPARPWTRACTIWASS